MLIDQKMYVPNPIPRHFYSQKERQERFRSHHSLHKEQKTDMLF